MAPRFRRGVLITLEGGEGSGKTTLAESLARLLREEDYQVLLAREPAGTELGRTIKAIFQSLAASDSSAAVGPAAELFLFEAARAQHVQEVIRPALDRGQVVLCDRYVDSTLAYQGYGRGLSLDHIRACNHIATGGLMPDLTLLLDLPPEVGLARADRPSAGGAREQKAPDAIGQEPLAFHRRVRDGFLELARREPKRVAVLDAALPVAAVTQAAWARVRDLLEHVL